MKDNSHNQHDPDGLPAGIGTVMMILAWKVSPPVAAIAFMVLLVWLICHR
jgi:hypothetical protein